MSRNFFVGIIIALAVAVGVFYVSRQQSTPTSPGPQEQSLQPPEVQSEMQNDQSANLDDGGVAGDESTIKTFEIDGNNFSFSLEEIRVNQGDTVRIVFTNQEGFHNWMLDEFNASTSTIPEGETETIQFLADQAGSFEYYCSVGNHRQLGMVGTLIVE